MCQSGIRGYARLLEQFKDVENADMWESSSTMRVSGASPCMGQSDALFLNWPSRWDALAHASDEADQEGSGVEMDLSTADLLENAYEAHLSGNQASVDAGACLPAHWPSLHHPTPACSEKLRLHFRQRRRAKKTQAAYCPDGRESCQHLACNMRQGGSLSSQEVPGKSARRNQESVSFSWCSQVGRI